MFSFLGPCGGKTTGQARLCTFFENLGWKVGIIHTKWTPITLPFYDIGDILVV